MSRIIVNLFVYVARISLFNDESWARFVIRSILSCCLWLSCVSVWASGIAVNLDAAQIELGRQVRLTLTYDPSAAKGTPDLSALQTDFTIMATQQSMSYSIINGQARSVGQWSLVLEPKHAGLITIPVIHIGSLSSDPIQLNVSPAAVQALADKSMQDGDLQAATTLSVSVDNKTPYLHQEILYKVRLMTRSRLADVRYQAPQVDDAILFPLGTGQEYQTTREGVVYHVDEQIYAIFPQKSGPLLITPPSLQALSYDSIPTPVTITGEAVALQVQPLPKHTVRREWLPSKLVRLQEHDDQTETKFKQGATLVRTIVLQAQGLVAQLLPEIPFPDNADVRTYPGQAEQDTRIQQGELWGRTKVKVTYVFSNAGKVVLPAIRVPWFNVKTKKMEMAELPAKTYEITPSDPVTKPKLLVPKSKPHSLARPLVKQVLSPTWNWKPKVLIGGVLVMGLLGLLVVALRWRVRKSKPYRDLRAACKANDLARIKSALVAWGNQQWPDKDMRHFTEMLPLLGEHDALRTAIQAFMTVLYHPNHETGWQAETLWRAIVAFKKHVRPKPVRKQIVPAIHPMRK